MLLENLRRNLEPTCYAETLEGVFAFYKTLRAELGKLNPKTLGTVPLSERQLITFDNCTGYLLNVLTYGKKYDYEEDLKRSVSECYDIVHNYMNTNRPITINEYCLLKHIAGLWGRIIEVI